MSKPARIDFRFSNLNIEYSAMGTYTCVSDQNDPDFEDAGAGRTPMEAVDDWVEKNREPRDGD